MTTTVKPLLSSVPAHGCDAAVLVLLTDQGSVLLGRRSRHLRRHGGEMAFPGGRRERGESPWQSALRESREEMGLGYRPVQRYGYLPQRRTRHGVTVCPCVGHVCEPFKPRPDGVEMTEGLWLPLAAIAGPDSQQWQRVYYRGQWREVLHYHWQGYAIWGITALILADVARFWQGGCAQ